MSALRAERERAAEPEPRVPASRSSAPEREAGPSVKDARDERLFSARADAGPRGISLIDMHCHLDFLPEPAAFAREAAADGTALFSNTVRPRDYDRARTALEGCPNVRVGLGAHPWWVADGSIGEEELAYMEEAIAGAPGEPGARLVGEVGLDFGRAHGMRRDAQVDAFRRIAACCAREGGKVLSIHAVRAAGPVLDVLEETGAAVTCTCVFHWFSGASDDLVRARSLGCWFSVGARMLATRKGRAYVRSIPRDRLLFETDLPACAGAELGYYEYRMQLEHTAQGLVQALHAQDTNLLESIAAASRGILFKEDAYGRTDALPAQA